MIYRGYTIEINNYQGYQFFIDRKVKTYAYDEEQAKRMIDEILDKKK
tara:strand:+ start:314 stop:454 length:141 start_codon:yes stop_codon:yes gene_type:complete